MAGDASTLNRASMVQTRRTLNTEHSDNPDINAFASHNLLVYGDTER
ncbi:hypothetical protein Cflav_PD6190 [Pedosphaera parvula Ellin514]|uniref:Uncharacterized protein n=1 Tax=Pedosphaera parvula (strain Ellin514) TaxID=320771 RepID=B9XHM2_PEDPL|nr:hypothetical protein Cflav_PD6190 [Pedosphaera parvula Ellin514]